MYDMYAFPYQPEVVKKKFLYCSLFTEKCEIKKVK